MDGPSFLSLSPEYESKQADRGRCEPGKVERGGGGIVTHTLRRPRGKERPSRGGQKSPSPNGTGVQVICQRKVGTPECEFGVSRNLKGTIHVPSLLIYAIALARTVCRVRKRPERAKVNERTSGAAKDKPRMMSRIRMDDAEHGYSLHKDKLPISRTTSTFAIRLF